MSFLWAIAQFIGASGRFIDLGALDMGFVLRHQNYLFLRFRAVFWVIAHNLGDPGRFVGLATLCMWFSLHRQNSLFLRFDVFFVGYITVFSGLWTIFGSRDPRYVFCAHSSKLVVFYVHVVFVDLALFCGPGAICRCYDPRYVIWAASSNFALFAFPGLLWDIAELFSAPEQFVGVVCGLSYIVITPHLRVFMSFCGL